MRPTPILVAVMALATLPLPSQESEGPRTTPPPGAKGTASDAVKPPAVRVLRERTVYIPHEKLEDVFEKAGRGIFLPYEEFLELWKKAQPKPPPEKPNEPPADAVLRGGAYAGNIAGENARFDVTLNAESLVDRWSEIALPLEDIAVESVELSDPEAIFATRAGKYSLILPRRGKYEAKLVFSARVSSSPGKKSLTFGIPPLAISHVDLTIPEKDARVTVEPRMAAVRATPTEGGTKVSAFVGNANRVAVSWTPPAGKVTGEGAVVFAEQSIRAYLGERILRLATRIGFQVVRGQVAGFHVRLPADMGLLSVKGANIREWNQKGDVLAVDLHSPVSDAYSLELAFERILAETPPAISIPVPVAQGVRRESGWLALGHDPSLKVRVTAHTNLSQLDPAEVPKDLRNGLRIGFRYLTPPEPLGLEVEEIEPRVRTSTRSIVVLGAEEDAWIGFVDYDIARAGLFRLELRVPEAWKVESIGDASTVEDYQAEETALGQRRLVVNLKSRALGKFRLPFHLVTDQGSIAALRAGTAAGPLSLSFGPPLVIRSEQDRGILGITAHRSIQLATEESQGVRSTDVQELRNSGLMGQVSEEADSNPLTYEYRRDAPSDPISVKLTVQSKKGEIRVYPSHLVEVTDAKVTITHYLKYEILHREVGSIRFTAPTSLDDQLRIESSDRKGTPQKRAVDGHTEWEITLQRATTGNVNLTITHEKDLETLEAGKPFRYDVPILRASGGEGVKTQAGFIAVVKRGTLEIVPETTGTEEVEAVQLPNDLPRDGIHTSLRYLSDSPTLALNLTRYDYEELTRTSVQLAYLTCVLADRPCKLRVRTVLLVENVDQRYLEVRLPEGVTNLDVWVGAKRESPMKRKEGDSYLLPIPTTRPGEQPFTVVIDYEEMLGTSMGSMSGVEFSSLEVLGNVPVQRAELDLYVPPGYTYLHWSGNARPDPHRALRSFGVEKFAGQFDTWDQVRHSFSSFAPRVHLGVIYSTPHAFRAVEAIAFLLLLALGLALATRTKLPRGGVCAGCVVVPLIVYWFLEPPADEAALAATFGGALVGVGFALRWLWTRLADWRRARRALAPDPFLEEAGIEREPESGAEETAPPAGTSGAVAPQGPEQGPQAPEGSVEAPPPELTGEEARTRPPEGGARRRPRHKTKKKKKSKKKGGRGSDSDR